MEQFKKNIIKSNNVYVNACLCVLPLVILCSVKCPWTHHFQSWDGDGWKKRGSSRTRGRESGKTQRGRRSVAERKRRKGKEGEEMQHLRQRKRGEDERFGSFEGNTSQDRKWQTEEERKREEFNLNASTEQAGGWSWGGGGGRRREWAKMQMKERKKGALIVPLIKKNCVCVCVCVFSLVQLQW